MSKSIVIQNDGTDTTYTGVNKIKTRKATGGTLYWIPEGEQPTAVKTVTANGTYKASDENLFAYSKAVVDVKAGRSSVTGRDRTSGNDYNVTVDSTTEQIVKTKIPSGIIIDTPPTTTSYTDGDTIDYTGMVVKTVDGNGDAMAVVPSSSVITPITKADKDTKVRAADDISPYPHIFYVGEGTQWDTHSYTYKASKTCKIASFYDSSTHNGLMVVASTTPATYSMYMGSYEISKDIPFAQRTFRGQTFYIYGEATNTERFTPIYNAVSLPSIVSDKTDAIAWAMLFGEASGGTSQLLPIKVENEYGDDDFFAYQPITVS